MPIKMINRYALISARDFHDVVGMYGDFKLPALVKVLYDDGYNNYVVHVLVTPNAKAMDETKDNRWCCEQEDFHIDVPAPYRFMKHLIEIGICYVHFDDSTILYDTVDRVLSTQRMHTSYMIAALHNASNKKTRAKALWELDLPAVYGNILKLKTRRKSKPVTRGKRSGKRAVG